MPPSPPPSPAPSPGPPRSASASGAEAEPVSTSAPDSAPTPGSAPPRLRLGTTSFSYKDWIGTFYPAGTPSDDLLPRYARVFDTVEVDSTFYRMPKTETTARWAQDTPPGFTITVKVPRRVTHDAGMVGEEEYLAAFFERLAPLREAGRLGPVLAQFPASFPRKRGFDALAPFLDRIPDGVRMAFEFRNKSWFDEEVFDLLRKRGAALVWQVNQEGMLPASPVVTADFLYVRLIGADRVFSHHREVQRDLRPRMGELREALAAHAGPASDVEEAFLLCSNHFEGHGPASAARLADVLGLPPPDLAAAKRGGGQAMLGDFG